MKKGALPLQTLPSLKITQDSLRPACSNLRQQFALLSGRKKKLPLGSTLWFSF